MDSASYEYTYPEDKVGRSDSRVPNSLELHHGESEHHKNLSKLKKRKKYFFGTYNINSLVQIGKLKQLTTELHRFNISILALQETRFVDEDTFESDGFRIFKGKVGNRKMKNMPHLGTAFMVRKKFLDSVTDFRSVNARLSFLTIKALNKKYTLINAHAPINNDNRTNPEKVEEFWDELEAEILKIPSNHVRILLGDFNAQLGSERKFTIVIGKYPAHRRTNRNGERLVKLCERLNLKIMSTHFKAKPSKKKTWVSPNAMLGEFQLDHVAISQNCHQEIQNVKVRKSINVTSDHYLSQIKMNFIPYTRKNSTKVKIPKFNREALKNEKRIEFQEKLKTPKNWNDVTQNLIKCAQETVPLNFHKKHAWWNEDCENAIKERLRAWKKWNGNKTQENLEEVRRLRKVAHQTLRKTRRKYITEQMMEMEENFKKNDTRLFYRAFKNKINGYSAPSFNFKREDGTLALNNRENCNILAAYFEKLLNCEKPQGKLSFKFTTQNPDSEPPEREEIKSIINSLKNNKASGEDGIIAELWKLADEEFIAETTKLFQRIWTEETIPEDWLVALIHPLHKKGSKTDVNNYRGISLLPVTYKIFSKLLLNRLEPQIDSKLGEYQGGFRRNRSCIEQILSIKLILKYYNARPKNIFISFIDFQKAYDSVDRETIFDTLKEYQVDQKTINLIKLTLTNTISKVKFLGEVSEPFQIKTGLRQGDGLSPILFNLVLDKVMRTFWEDNDSSAKIGTKHQNLRIKCLAFADDLALFAESEQEAINQIDQLKETAEKTGLQISFVKTEMMTSDSTYSKTTIKTKYGKIKITDRFKYLGEIISRNGTDKPVIEAKKHKLEQLNFCTKNIYNKKNLSVNAKLRHYNTVVKPVILYGMETTTISGMENLLKIERRILRRIYGPRRTQEGYRLRSNEEIYSKIEDLEVTIRKRRLNFYGHMVRMGQSRLNKQIFDKIWNYKGQGGYVKQMKEELKKFNIAEKDCLDRQEYRNKIFGLKVLVGEKKDINRGEWTDERRAEQSKRMKDFWRRKKEAT